MGAELMRAATPLVLALAVLAPREAAAHIEITSHQTRHGVNSQKIAPCGVADDPGPGDNVYTYAPGDTITIAWNEFIDHPGHYRVAFDAEGDDDFVDPAAADDLYNDETVLLDGIPDEADVHDYEVELTLPEVECESCTIQILQVMTDKPPFGDGNDMYYHCIDVRLVAEGGDGDGDPGDGDGDGDGDSSDGTDEVGAETGSASGDGEAGLACAASRPQPLAATPLALLTLGLIRRRRTARDLGH